MFNFCSKMGSLLSISETYVVHVRDIFIDLRLDRKLLPAVMYVPTDTAVPWLL